MRNKRFLLILICLLMVFSILGLTGCGKKEEIVIKEKDYRITLFFANEKYLEEGDESLEKYMVFESEIKSMPADAYKMAVESLRTSPEDGYETLLEEQIIVNSVYLEGNTAYVDLSSQGLNGSSLEESFLIGQIVNTLINSFAEIEQVQFLVDGQTVESLMGHVDAGQPFEHDVFTE